MHAIDISQIVTPAAPSSNLRLCLATDRLAKRAITRDTSSFVRSSAIRPTARLEWEEKFAAMAVDGRPRRETTLDC